MKFRLSSVTVEGCDFTETLQLFRAASTGKFVFYSFRPRNTK